MSRLDIDPSKNTPFCREKGIGSTFTPATTSREQSYIDNNRIEVLRLILVLLSKQIYQSPSSILTTPTRYTQYIVQKVSRKLVLTTLCSLLNVVVNSPSNQAQSSISAGIAGVGKGITKGLNQLPYTQGWNGEDAREGLVSTAVQVLITLLDYQSANARDIPSNGPSTRTQAASEPGSAQYATAMPSPSVSQPGILSPLPNQGMEDRAPSPKTNHFRYFLSKIHRPADLKYLLDGLLAVLGGWQFLPITLMLIPGCRGRTDEAGGFTQHGARGPARSRSKVSSHNEQNQHARSCLSAMEAV